MIRIFELLIAVTTWLAIKGWRFLVCLLIAIIIHRVLSALNSEERIITALDIPLNISALLVASLWQMRSSSLHSD